MNEVAKFQDLKTVMLRHVAKVYIFTGRNKTKTAEILKVSLRTVGNYINRCKERDIDVGQTPGPVTTDQHMNFNNYCEEQSLDYDGMPTNEERIKHKDSMINRDRL